MKYLFYPGCNAEQVEKEALESTYAVCEELGIELIYADDLSCCGATHVDKVDGFLNLLINARNLARAEQKGLDIMTICNTCYIVMRQVQSRLEADAKLCEEVNLELGKVGLRYAGRSKVLHIVDAFYEFGTDELRRRVVRELDVKIAPFYGCHILRPAKAVGRSQAETEQIVDEIIEAVGAEVINYDRESSCCGFHVTMANPQLCAKLNGWNMLNAKDSEADALVTPCTLCHTVMDGQQHRAEKEIGEKIRLPVLHLPQMIGLALGISEKRLGLGRHIVNVNAFLEKLAYHNDHHNDHEYPEDPIKEAESEGPGQGKSITESTEEHKNLISEYKIPPPLSKEDEEEKSDL